MKKFPLFLALALMLSANSFAQKGNKDFELRETSKDCHWVCENGEMVLYKGSKKVVPVSSGKGDILAGLGGGEENCPRLSKESLKDGELNSKNCKGHKKGKRK